MAVIVILEGSGSGQRGRGCAVIALPRKFSPSAAAQAGVAGRSLAAELLHLAVHGLAHLLGYDHATAAEERVMFGYEAALRAQAESGAAVKPVAAPAWPPLRKSRVTSRR